MHNSSKGKDDDNTNKGVNSNVGNNSSKGKGGDDNTNVGSKDGDNSKKGQGNQTIKKNKIIEYVSDSFVGDFIGAHYKDPWYRQLAMFLTPPPWSDHDRFLQCAMEVSTAQMIVVCDDDPFYLSELGRRVCWWPHLFYKAQFVSEEAQLRQPPQPQLTGLAQLLTVLSTVVSGYLYGVVVGAVVLAVLIILSCYLLRRVVYIVDEALLWGRTPDELRPVLTLLNQKAVSHTVILLCTSKYVLAHLHRVVKLRLPTEDARVSALPKTPTPEKCKIEKLSPEVSCPPSLLAQMSSVHLNRLINASRLPSLTHLVISIELGCMAGPEELLASIPNVSLSMTIRLREYLLAFREVLTILRRGLTLDATHKTLGDIISFPSEWSFEDEVRCEECLLMLQTALGPDGMAVVDKATRHDGATRHATQVTLPREPAAVD